jgi:T-complex protein 1 subunit alpha
VPLAFVCATSVTAAVSVANIVKTSLGPVGLDKMLVDDIGDVTVTNDGATILRLLDVQHPAAKVLVQLAELQDEEVGDGTTSVVIVAAELLKLGNQLIKQKIHATSVIAGYRLACREATKYIKQHLSVKSDALGREILISAARTSMSSKLIGAESAFFSQLAVDAVLRVKTTDKKDKVVYPINAINVLKAHGKSARESVLVEGYALNCTISSQQMPRIITDAKIALLDFNLQKTRLDMGVQVIVQNPEELNAIRQRESDIIKERIALILAAGANVVLTTKGIDDLCLKYLVEAGAIGVRRCLKEDLNRIAKATGGTLVTTLGDLEGNESFSADLLGKAKVVEQVRVADDELILVRGATHENAASIILRGPNSFSLDEMERSLHDAICVVKRTLESGYVVAGGGAVEVALSVYLEDFAKSLGSREQLAIAEFAHALLVIPKTLAQNAAKDSAELVSQMRAQHHAAQADANEKQRRFAGLDLVAGTVRDNIAAGVVEPAMAKIKALKSATEAAIQVRRTRHVFHSVRGSFQSDSSFFFLSSPSPTDLAH